MNLNKVIIRLLDLLLSFIGLTTLFPFLFIISILIKLSGKGPVLYKQYRVGRDNRDFTLLKFRTMFMFSNSKGLLTIGFKDPRITPIGSFLRRYKLDELPQLINVLIGQMSMVGPRPEVRKYVDLYTEEQKRVLTIRPGITDYASIKYRHENEILAQRAEPEQYYINHIMPDKLRMNLEIVNNHTFANYFKAIIYTFLEYFTY